MENKTKLLSEFAALLPNTFTADEIRAATTALTMALKDYDVVPASRAIAPVDTESEKLLKKFLATKRVEGRSEKTIERYRYIIARFYHSINCPLDEVDVYALRLYLAEVAAILGHANINTTTTYIYVNKENVKANYKRFAS